ncbi:MAG: membrane integrity-associated transporter subunit PqiC [bacterium]|nr:MAG: membrane integrity-associated transporter subunit PqiC [bacterium]
MILSRKLYIIFIATFIFFQCSGSIPEMHYYLIDYPISMKSDNSELVHQIVLGVKRFEAAPLYREERLVYRDSPYEGKYYHYHRWIATPEEMITEKVIEQLSASKLFEQVVAFPKFSQVEYVLMGTIKALEEWDEDDKWYARVQISYELMKNASNQIVWQKTIEKKNIVPHKSPAEVVKAINLGVQQCVAECEQHLAAFFNRL